MNKMINKIGKNKLMLIAAGVVIGIVVVWWLIRGVQQTEVSMEADQTIDITPEQIESIRAIGQWEFLSISNEELVDTTRKGLFRDDHLARIPGRPAGTDSSGRGKSRPFSGTRA